MVPGEGSFHGDGGTRTEDLGKVGWSAEVNDGRCLKETASDGVSGEDVETFTEDTFKFREARKVSGDKGLELVLKAIFIF